MGASPFLCFRGHGKSQVGGDVGAMVWVVERSREFVEQCAMAWVGRGRVSLWSSVLWRGLGEVARVRGAVFYGVDWEWSGEFVEQCSVE